VGGSEIAVGPQGTKSDGRAAIRPPPGPIAYAASESKRSGWIPSPGYSFTSVSIHVHVFPAPSQTIFF